MGKIVFAPAAQADLVAQWDFYADEVGDVDLADRFVRSVEQTAQKLARNPELGRSRAFRAARNVRAWAVSHFPKHIIFYRAATLHGGVEIIRILHGARDLDALFR